MESGRGAEAGRTERGAHAEQQIAELSRHFVSLDADAIDAAVRDHLGVAGELADADASTLVVMDPVERRVEAAYTWNRAGHDPVPVALDMSLVRRLTWSRTRLEQGRVIQIRGLDELPAEAEAERQVFAQRRTASALILPVHSGRRLFGGQVFESRSPRRWSEPEVGRLRLLGDIFASAIERRRSELALRESEARFRAFAENALELVAEFDGEGRYRYASPSYRDLLGHDPQALIGRWGDLLVHPDERDQLLASFRAAFGETDGSRLLCRLRHADGSWRWFENAGRAYTTAEGKLRFVSIGRDVTETRAMVDAMGRQLAIEKQIAELSRRFLALETSALDDAIRDAVEEAGALARADRAYLYAPGADDGNPFQRHYEWRAAGIESFVGGPRRDWSKSRLLAGEILHFESMEMLPAEAVEERRSLARRGVRSLLAIPVHARGRFAGVIGFETMRARQHWTRHEVALLKVIGEILATAMERRRSEAALRESETKLQQVRKLEAVGRLAGGIAHDFNNLLTVILGFSRPLLRELPEGDPVREDVGEIHAAAERAAALTRQLLTFSRRQSSDETVVSLNAVLEDLSPLLARLLGEDIEIGLELDPALRAVKGDPHQFEQVVLNLAANARDAMPDGGHLVLSTANRRLDEDEARRLGLAAPGAHVLLSVRDTGEGIDDETRARMFDPFFTTKEPGKGTGLGLAIVFSVVERAGGAIDVKGDRGKGACFEIWLPAAASAARRGRPDVPLPLAGGSETVLLVEDEAAVRRLTGGMLRRAGYQVLEACDGIEALAVAEAFPERIDALLSDLVMPRLGGNELARRLTQQRPGLKTLLITGYPGEGEGLPRGASARVLEKPFSEEALLDRLRELLDGPAA